MGRATLFNTDIDNSKKQEALESAVVYQERVVEVPVYVDKIVYQDRVEYKENLVEVEKIVYVDKIEYKDKIVQVDKIVYEDRFTVVEKPIEKIVYVDKIIEKFIDKEVKVVPKWLGILLIMETLTILLLM